MDSSVVLGIDIGGSLAKLVIFEPKETKNSKNLEVSVYQKGVHGLDNSPIENDLIIKHLSDFYNLYTEEISFVHGSIEYLNKIQNELGCQIIVLSNLPHHNREKREVSFKNKGLNFPIISNSGLKGMAIKEIAKKQENKIFFIDDISANLLSTYNEIDGVKLIHYISDKRLEKLAITPKEVDFKAKNWKEIYNYIENEISR